MPGHRQQPVHPRRWLSSSRSPIRPWPAVQCRRAGPGLRAGIHQGAGHRATDRSHREEPRRPVVGTRRVGFQRVGRSRRVAGRPEADLRAGRTPAADQPGAVRPSAGRRAGRTPAAGQPGAALRAADRTRGAAAGSRRAGRIPAGQSHRGAASAAEAELAEPREPVHPGTPALVHPGTRVPAPARRSRWTWALPQSRQGYCHWGRDPPHDTA